MSSRPLKGACPTCSESYVYRQDSLGENVREWVLRLDPHAGCVCWSCNSYWSPAQFLELAASLKG